MKRKTTKTNCAIELSDDMCFDELFKDSKAGETYVDVGAFNGDTIRLALIYNRKLKMVAVEPVSESARKISEINPDIKVICSAASDRQGTIKLHVYPSPYEGCSTLEEYMTKAHSTLMPPQVRNIPCERLDVMLRDNGIKSVDYVKIDCEGHEEQVLSGFSLYHSGTRFHVEYHINNLANVLYQLKSMNVEPFKVTLSKDAVKRDVTVGYVLAVAK